MKTRVGKSHSIRSRQIGKHRVSGIVTFGHLLTRAVARDVGRIIGFDDKTLNEISKLIPHQLGITLDEAYEDEQFKQFVHRNHRHEKWFELSKKLEGFLDILQHMQQVLLLTINLYIIMHH